VNLITIEQARGQVNADDPGSDDPVDDEMLTIYAGAAEEAAMQFLNRRIFADTTARTAAIAELPAMLAAADAAYTAAMEEAADLEGSAREALEQAACDARGDARTLARETYRSRMINDAILAGMLLILGHLYRNRESVVTGQGAAAVELPMGAIAFLFPYRIDIGV
jgi:hypothetical protein